MLQVYKCPEFRKENTKTGILLKQKDCVFYINTKKTIQFNSIS